VLAATQRMVLLFLQVTEEHWSRAANLSPTASPIDGDLAEILTLLKKLGESPRVFLRLSGNGVRQRISLPDSLTGKIKVPKSVPSVHALVGILRQTVLGQNTR